MNAKFEKWFSDNYQKEYVSAINGGTISKFHMDAAEKSWQASKIDAIQSLEVTRELCQIAEAAYDAEEATPLCDSPAMKEALIAFLSALKEQAK